MRHIVHSHLWPQDPSTRRTAKVNTNAVTYTEPLRHNLYDKEVNYLPCDLRAALTEAFALLLLFVSLNVTFSLILPDISSSQIFFITDTITSYY